MRGEGDGKMIRNILVEREAERSYRRSKLLRFFGGILKDLFEEKSEPKFLKII